MYARLFVTQLRLSVALGLQYRWDFVTEGLTSLAWTALGLVPLWIAFHARASFAGWTFETALVVVAFFTLLRGVLEGAVNPSLIAVVEQIRQGTLDFVLMKPADAQFLVSTARFRLWKLVDVAAALGILAWALAHVGRAPRPVEIATAVLLLASAIVVLYAMWILVVSAAFWVVRLDNLTYLFNSVFDFAQWPSSVFRGVWRILFTFVIPLALMTTYPAQALLGELPPRTALFSVLGAAAFALVSRLVWSRSIGHYTSASS